MQKRGYFFVIDALVALLVLVVAVVLIFSTNIREQKTEQPFTLSTDVLKVLSTNKIKSINNDYAGSNSNLTRNGNITDIDKTLLEQVAEFYHRNKTLECGYCLQLIDSFLDNITVNMIPKEYDYMIILDNTTVYNHSTSPMNDSTFVIPSRTIVHGLYNGKDLYGPYLVEVLSWG